MKIALCLSGQPRFYKNGFNSVKRYIDEYDMDVFFHTWWHDFDLGKKYKKAEWSISDDNNLIVENNTFSDLVDLYKPKLYSNDKIINFDAEREYETAGDYKLIYNNVKSMYFSMKKVVELKMQYEKNNDVEYDFVLHSRFDNNIISLPNIHLLKKGHIYFINWIKQRKHIFHDIISICDGNLYNIRKNIFDNIDNYYDKMVHMEKNNIDMDYIKQMGKYMNAEEILSFNMYDEGCIDKSIKIEELKASVINR